MILSHEQENEVPDEYKFKQELLKFRASHAKYEKRVKDLKQNEQQSQANNNMGLGYKSKDGNMFGLYPRFFWDVSDVPFGGMPNIKMDSMGFRAGTAVERS